MEQESHPQTALDRLVSTEQTQMLKAALPYLPFAGQRMLSVYTKFTELKNTLYLFPANQGDMSVCEAPAPVSSPLEFLQELRPYCSGETGNKMDQMIHMIVMAQMLRLFQDVSS